MSVSGDHVEAKGAQLRIEGLEGHHLLGAADALDTVAVDEPHDVGQLAMGNEEGGLPDAALVELAIGREAEEAPLAAG